MSAELKVLSLPTHARPRIVEILERRLAEAKEGKITGVFLIVEDENGAVEHDRDGFPLNQIVFSLEVIKKRLLKDYE